MPSLTLQYNKAQGPIIELLVGVTAAREAALVQAGQHSPAFVTARMLIDSGASHTCLDPSIITPLGLSPTGSVSIQTPSTKGVATQVSQYDVRLLVAHPVYKFFDAIPVSECHLASQGIHGLLGRDILESCVLVMNGEVGLYTLCF